MMVYLTRIVNILYMITLRLMSGVNTTIKSLFEGHFFNFKHCEIDIILLQKLFEWE